MSSHLILIEEDCTVLLERAFLGRTVCAFGEDGFGLYGKKDTPSFFKITRINIDVQSMLDVKVTFMLSNYNHEDVGHIQTDKNFDICMNNILDEMSISRNALSWAPINEQAFGGVTYLISVPELLGWI